MDVFTITFTTFVIYFFGVLSGMGFCYVLMTFFGKDDEEDEE